ncbi:hypothetical protein BHM03_00020581, partial [Ensete ventricosum]
MSPERPFGDSGTEHHPEPDHPRPTEEATVAVPTPNRFWRMMTDPGFPSPASNPTPGNGADHSPVPAPARAFDGSPIGSPGGTPANGVTSGPKPGNPTRRRAPTASGRRSPRSFPDPDASRSQSRCYNPVPTELDFDTLSTDTADSLREQDRRVHQRLDEVQKEVLKSREEVGESSKGGSPFTPEIQAKPLPATFRLPALEPY